MAAPVQIPEPAVAPTDAERARIAERTAGTDRRGRRLRALVLTTSPHPDRDLVPAGWGRSIEVAGRASLEDLQSAPVEADGAGIDLAIVLLSRRAPDELRDRILDLHRSGMAVRIIPWSPPLDEPPQGGVEKFAAPLSASRAAAKRALDLLLVLPLLLLALPVMAIIAAVIRGDSRGPALFRQWRVGYHGKPFLMYKFRTMYHQTEQAEAGLGGGKEPESSAEHEFKLPEDPRITRIGRFLRRSSLDELPQLLNVLRGEMSLVGPRPELMTAVKRYSTWQLARLAVPPGMTGWWQINGRSNRPMHLKMQDDLYYLQHCSPLTDLVILARTALPVIRGTGAY